jgi:K+-sensing histidine kinase KdpD
LLRIRRKQDYNAVVAKDDETIAAVMRLLSHDLRNPLTAVQLNAQLIECAAMKAGREKEQRWASLIVGAARRIDGLIQQLVEAERLRLGQLQLKSEAVTLEQLWRDILNGKGGELACERVHLTLPERCISILGDHERLVRAFRDLVGLSIEQADAAAAVVVTVELVDGVVCTSMRSPRPSEGGAASSPSASPPPSSPGIGLHVIRTVLQCHGGDLRCREGDPGVVDFTVTLPTTAST